GSTPARVSRAAVTCAAPVPPGGESPGGMASTVFCRRVSVVILASAFVKRGSRRKIILPIFAPAVEDERPKGGDRQRQAGLRRHRRGRAAAAHAPWCRVPRRKTPPPCRPWARPGPNA